MQKLGKSSASALGAFGTTRSGIEAATCKMDGLYATVSRAECTKPTNGKVLRHVEYTVKANVKG